METLENITNKDLVRLDIQLLGTDAATAANYDQIFIANRPYEVVEISEVHRVAGTNGSDVTLNIERLSGTEALDSGDTLCVAGFNLKGTVYTVVTKKTTDLVKASRTLNVGDRLALKDTGTLTSVAGLVVSILLKPLGKGDYR